MTQLTSAEQFIADAIADAVGNSHERGTDRYADGARAITARFDVTTKPPKAIPPTDFILSPSEQWSRGFRVGRWPGYIDSGVQHLAAEDVIERVRSQHVVYIIGGWDDDLSRAGRLTIERHLYESGARLLNGNGSEYGWPDPLPWDRVNIIQALAEALAYQPVDLRGGDDFDKLSARLIEALDNAGVAVTVAGE